MTKLKRLAFISLALLALSICAQNHNAQGADDIIKRCQPLLTNADPVKRAEGVEGIVAANNKKAAELACKTIAAEKDNDALPRMGAAFAQFNSEEALSEVKDAITKFTRPEQIFAAYYALTGLGNGKTAGGDAILKACVLESKPKDYNLKAAALEAIGESARKEVAPAVAELFATWNPDWDDKGVIVAMCGIFAAAKIVKPEEKEPRDSVMRGLINILKNAKNDRLRYFSVKALSEISGEKMYSEPKFWEWWIDVGGYKTQKERPEGQTEAARKVPRFFDMATVGKRVVFCIDVSGSMAGPVSMPPAPKKEKPPEPKKEGPVTGGGKSKPCRGRQEERGTRTRPAGLQQGKDQTRPCHRGTGLRAEATRQGVPVQRMHIRYAASVAAAFGQEPCAGNAGEQSQVHQGRGGPDAARAYEHPWRTDGQPQYHGCSVLRLAQNGSRLGSGVHGQGCRDDLLFDRRIAYCQR
jgi:hypothetical protein